MLANGVAKKTYNRAEMIEFLSGAHGVGAHGCHGFERAGVRPFSISPWQDEMKVRRYGDSYPEGVNYEGFDRVYFLHSRARHACGRDDSSRPADLDRRIYS